MRPDRTTSSVVAPVLVVILGMFPDYFPDGRADLFAIDSLVLVTHVHDVVADAQAAVCLADLGFHAEQLEQYFPLLGVGMPIHKRRPAEPVGQHDREVHIRGTRA
jgi:hypothetical protein